MEKPIISVAGSRAALSGRRSFLLVVFAASLLLAFILGTGEARACSCVGLTTEEQIQTADAVFLGTVVDAAENTDPYAPPGLNLGPVTFDVETTWKGVPGDPAVVLGQGNEGSCGLDFQVGESYLVYAQYGGEYGDGPLTTSTCLGTKPLSSAGADLMALGLPPYSSDPLEEPGPADGGNSAGSIQYDNAQ